MKAAERQRPLLKICGLMRGEDVQLCGRLHVDIAGFVVDYPTPVPWNLSPAEAAPLLSLAKAPMKTCLVTGGAPESSIALAEALRPDFVQLHGHETLADTVRVVEAVSSWGIGVIKLLPADPEERYRQFGEKGAVACAKLLQQSGVRAILVDSRDPARAAVGGLPNGELFQQVCRAVETTVILAGGITPETAGRVVAELRPQALDVMTGVERVPGVKSEAKLKALLRALTPPLGE